MEITTETEYNNALHLINKIMKKGEHNVTQKETEVLRQLTLAVPEYECVHYNFT